MLLENSLRHRLIADLDGLHETKPGRAALHEQVEDPSVAELVRNRDGYLASLGETPSAAPGPRTGP